MQIEEKLHAMGLSLPRLEESGVGHHVRAVRVGKLVFLGGYVARGEKGVVQGKFGENITVKEGYEAAKLTALNLLSILKDEIGDLDSVERIVMLRSYLVCTPDFGGLAQVSNGASDLLLALYGDNGVHTRTTVGTVALGAGSCVEIELIVELK
jgi:enamine deaminase RidA (YjgF/YER057c/UK114 family)